MPDAAAKLTNTPSSACEYPLPLIDDIAESLFFALTTLTNLGTVIFIIPICIGIIKNSDSFKKLMFKGCSFNFKNLIFGPIFTM